ncbi:hypothetical protein [Robertkochia solimangrovi]|nr:hypothetical protein [Robertkochia solimangrovi]
MTTIQEAQTGLPNSVRRRNSFTKGPSDVLPASGKQDRHGTMIWYY